MIESPGLLTAVAVLAILLLLFLVMRTKLQAFVALLVVSILVGLFTGMDFQKIIQSMQKGMAGTLGYVAVVVGLGAMFGEMLRVSGGSERLALTLVDKFGEKRVHWALALTGFIIAIPVFFDVAFIIIVPILYSLAQRTKKSLLLFGIPLLAGLAVTHSFVPPTPGPMAVASVLNADIGWVIIFGLLAGLPAMAIAGPIFGKYIAKKIHVEVPEYMLDEIKERAEINAKELPSFKTIILLILLPLVLIVLNTVSKAAINDPESTLQQFLTFIGHPFIALTITTLLTFWILGRLRGYSRQEVQDVATRSLEPAGLIILITGAGGVFGQMLVSANIDKVLAGVLEETSMPLIVFAFIVAAVVRIAQGSATVSMITAAGLVNPVIQTMANPSEALLGLLVIAIAAGATIFSHVNDSGFWLVNRYFGLTEKETLKSWSIMETLIAVTAFIVVLIISLFI